MFYLHLSSLILISCIRDVCRKLLGNKFSNTVLERGEILSGVFLVAKFWLAG